MSLTLLIVFITAIVAGIGFWFYNRRQINSLTETIEDKNAVINSFRGHLTSSDESNLSNPTQQTTPVRFDPNSEPVIDLRTEKKKKQRYGNRPKKNSSNQPKQTENQVDKKSSDKKNRPKPRRKPKTQQ